jgi:hypothetical protein
MRLAIVVFASWFALGCGNKDSGPAPVSSSTSTPVAPLPDAPESPLAVVLESKTPITFSGLGGGVVVTNEARTTLAMAEFGGELSANPMPTGLPAEGRIVRFSGRVPGSIWVIFEEPSKSAPKNPFLRLERRQGAFKQYADDWKPHLAAWSNRRILSMSTSSGKLKIKVLEPSQDKPLPDWPSPALSDEACAKSIKVEAIAALPTGEAFASGTCKTGDSGRKHVIVRWPVASATNALDGGIADAGIADAAIARGGATNSGSDAGITDAGTDDAGDAGDGLDGGDAPAPPVGIPGEVFAIAGGRGAMKHQALVARDAGDVWLLRSDETTSSLHRLEASTMETQPLPAFQGPARALASTKDGTLWLLSANAIWKRGASGTWEEIPPPTRAFPEPDPRWEMLDVAASESDVWIAAKHSSSKATRHVVLRLRPAKDIMQWP